MKCSCSIAPILAIVGLAGLGFGGYNMLNTGCPLGTCGSPESAAVTTTAAIVPAAAVETQPTECAMKCHGESKAVEVITAAHVVEGVPLAECTDSESCCKGAGEACCKGKAETECGQNAKKNEVSECPHSATPAKDSGAN